MKTYLVTGGAGFIGSHVIDQLLELDPTNDKHFLKNEEFPVNLYSKYNLYLPHY